MTTMMQVVETCQCPWTIKAVHMMQVAQNVQPKWVRYRHRGNLAGKCPRPGCNFQLMDAWLRRFTTTRVSVNQCPVLRPWHVLHKMFNIVQVCFFSSYATHCKLLYPSPPNFTLKQTTPTVLYNHSKHTYLDGTQVRHTLSPHAIWHAPLSCSLQMTQDRLLRWSESTTCPVFLTTPHPLRL